MHEPNDEDDIDRAYRLAVDATTDLPLVRRRRGAVMEAIAALHAVDEPAADRSGVAPGDRTAANEAHRHASATWWRGLAAACVIGSSALVVVHMQQAPEATVETTLRPDADRALAPAHESTAARDARPEPPQSSLESQPTPSKLADPLPRAPIGPATASAAVRSGTAPEPVVKAARSAFPGDAVTEAVAGPVGPSGAAAAPADSTRGEPAAAAPRSIPGPMPASPVRQEGPTLRRGQPWAAPQDAMGAAATQPPSHVVPAADLLLAVKQGDIEAARKALQTTDPDAERDAEGRTALAIAVLRADLPLVKLLLESGANRRAVDRHGQTPVSYSNASGDTTIQRALQGP